MTAPTELLALVAAAHRRVEDLLAGLTDADARAPSILPGWSIGHVVTHIARNADSFAWLTSAAVAGEAAHQYPGGTEQRDADIETGSGRSANVLVADVRSAHLRLATLWQLTPDGVWASGRGTGGNGTPTTAPEWVLRRMREAEVHRTDTGLGGLTWRDWPDDFVDAQLGDGPHLGPDGQLAPFVAGVVSGTNPFELVATDRPGRWTLAAPDSVGDPVTVEADRRTLLAWLMGRTDRP